MQGDDFLGDSIPVGKGLERFEVEGFHLFAEGSLLVEILLFLCLACLEEILMALVDDGRGGLEAVPDFFAQIALYGSDFAELLMQLLEFAEGGHHVFFADESLGTLAKRSFEFEVLLEVVGAEFVIEFERVVELLHEHLIGLPEVGSLLCGHLLDVVPLLLQGLEIVVCFVDFIGFGEDLLDFLDDTQFQLVVLLKCLNLCLVLCCALLANECHLLFEDDLLGIGLRHVVLRCTSTVDVCLVSIFVLLFENAVEIAFERIHFLSRYFFFAYCEGFQTVNNLGGRLVVHNRSGFCFVVAFGNVSICFFNFFWNCLGGSFFFHFSHIGGALCHRLCFLFLWVHFGNNLVDVFDVSHQFDFLVKECVNAWKGNSLVSIKH